MLQLHRACYMWRVSAGLTQSQIYGSEKVKAVSAFENGRSTNINHFERYLEIAIEMDQKSEFDYYVNYQIELQLKRNKKEG